MRGTVAILTLTLSLCLCFASNQSQAAPGPAIDSAIPQPDSSETVNTGSESPRPEHPLQTDAQSPAPMESAPERKADPRAERGLTSTSNQFVPRGQWIFGASASYSTHTNKDYTFLVIEDINSDGYTFKVTPLIAYAIRDNMAIGVKFIYSRSLLRIDSGSIKLGSDIDLGVDFYNALQHNYSGAFIWRQYIPLGQNKRFALFNETSLTLGGGQSRFAADSPIRGTYETNFSASIGISPGLVAFATNNVAFEVNVGVMGLSYTRTRQVHNQVTVGKRTSSLMNFKVNILSIGLGISLYL